MLFERVCAIRIKVADVAAAVDVLELHKSNRGITISRVDDNTRQIRFRATKKLYDYVLRDLPQTVIVRYVDSFGREVWKAP